MSNEQVIQIGRVTTNLSIEVSTATLHSTTLKNNQHSLSQFINIDRELIGIPTVLNITAVSINSTKHTCIHSTLKFVFESMTGQRSVVYFNVHFEIFFQTKFFQEADNCFGIHIILMFHWFHWFWFNQEYAFETFCTGIIAGFGQHGTHVLFFTFHISIQQRHITFASSPENISFTTQFDSCIHSIFNLNHCTGCCIKIRICAGSVHIACMRKYIGSTPHQFNTCCSLFFFCISHNSFQISFIFFNAATFANQIDIVKTVIFDTHFLHKFKSCIHFVFSSLQCISSSYPWVVLCSASKWITTFGTQ